MLTLELARAIVNKLMNVLGKNINIMDETGIIIASGDPLRVGTFHEGAAQAIKIQKPFEVNADDVKVLEGVRPGINVPITFKDKVVGVVGITGDPAEVRNYAQLVRFTTELMLEQAELKENIYMQKRASETYLQDLLSGNWGKDVELFIREGSHIGFDLSIPRIAMVLDLSKYGEFLKEQDKTSYGEFLFQHKMDGVLNTLRYYLNLQSDIIGYIGASNFVILTGINLEESNEQQCLKLNKLAKRIAHIVEDYINFNVLIGVGRYYPGLEGLRKSYIEALNAIKLGQLFYPSKKIHFFKNLLIEHLLTKIPLSERKDFYIKTLKNLVYNHDTDSNCDYTRELLDSLKVFLEENLSVKKTAERLYVHRNTIMHRLKKIQTMTGMDPSNFTDAFYLKLALLFFISDSEK